MPLSIELYGTVVAHIDYIHILMHTQSTHRHIQGSITPCKDIIREYGSTLYLGMAWEVTLLQ